MIRPLGCEHAGFRDAALGVCGGFFPAQSLSAIGTYWGCAGIRRGSGGRGRSPFRGVFPAFEHAPYGGRAQVQARAGERLRDLDAHPLPLSRRWEREGGCPHSQRTCKPDSTRAARSFPAARLSH